MQRKVSSLQEKVKEIYDYQIDREEVEKKLTGLEDRSRRTNLRIDGVAEENGESWDHCEQKVKEIFMDKLELENDIIIERVHRAKKSKYDKKNQLPTVVSKLLSYKDKVKVLRNCKKLKGSHMYIKEVFYSTEKSSGKSQNGYVKRKIRLLIFSIIQLWSRIKATYVKLTSFSCLNKVSPKQNKNDSRHSLSIYVL